MYKRKRAADNGCSVPCAYPTAERVGLKEVNPATHAPAMRPDSFLQRRPPHFVGREHTSIAGFGAAAESPCTAHRASGGVRS